MPNTSLSLLVLKTPHVQRLRDFYAALGIVFKQEQHGTGPIHYSGQLDSVVLEIYPTEDIADDATRLGFVVEEINAVIDAVESLQCTFVSMPKETAWGLRAVVVDPDGRSVELYQKP